ncbi:MAG: formate/nitrite transporter family protein [Chloroflexi bacterium]|nr:formate/nitrite transporter family protein [Chloroflexota bacterium]
MAVGICEACGGAFLGEPSLCPDCGVLLQPRGDIRRLPQEVVLGFVDHAEEFLSAEPVKQAALAFAAGSFITFGAMLSVVLTVGIEQEGFARLLLGLGFAAGFTLVVLSGVALFTEVNVLLPEMFLRRPRDLCRRCWRFWAIVYAGNAAGALFVGLLINGAQIIGPEQAERLTELIGEKMQFKELGVEGWFAVLLSGILGNWLVGMAAFLATAARTISGKILGILFPIVAFVAIGLQHSPANMGYFSIGLIHGDVGVGWGEAIWWNLVPATIGNLIGGAVLVALLFWYAFGRDPKRTQALRRAEELVRERGAERRGSLE